MSFRLDQQRLYQQKKRQEQKLELPYNIAKYIDKVKTPKEVLMAIIQGEVEQLFPYTRSKSNFFWSYIGTDKARDEYLNAQAYRILWSNDFEQIAKNLDINLENCRRDFNENWESLCREWKIKTAAYYHELQKLNK